MGSFFIYMENPMLLKSLFYVICKLVPIMLYDQNMKHYQYNKYTYSKKAKHSRS